LGLETAATFLAPTVDHAISAAVVADLSRLADLLLLPSREEGFGIPVLEAGLAGIPVFCSDIHALRELGGEDVHYFSPNAEPKLVAKAIASVLQASKLFALRKRALQRYTWEGIYQDGIAPLLAEGTR
ncbi:MAG: glycosyltransferase, partial [Anaerolineae bacterium]